MSLPLSTEQREFKDSLRSFFSDRLTSSYLRKRCEESAPSDPVLWKDLLDLGLISYFAGDGTSVELGLIAFESGWALEPEGIAQAIVAGPLTGLSSGDSRWGIAPPGSFHKLQVDQKRTVVSGELYGVPLAEACHSILVPLEQGRAGVIAVDNDGVTLKRETCLDETRKLYTVQLKGAPYLPLSDEASTRMEALLRIVVASEMAGVCARACHMTTEYVKTRKQFGVPVGGFQAVQHKLADMHVHSEAMRALSHFASWACDHSVEQRALSSSAALTFACEHGPTIVETAIQLHGGIAFTWEYDLHLYLRRAKALSVLFGSEASLAESLLEAAIQRT